MIKEVSIIKAFEDYREAMDYTKTILEDVVLLTIHGKNGKKLHGPISKTNIQEILNLFKEKTQQETEPVAWFDKEMNSLKWKEGSRNCDFYDNQPFYTTPPQREWVGLTDEEIREGNKDSWVTRQAWESAAWWAEAKLKEKNT